MRDMPFKLMRWRLSKNPIRIYKRGHEWRVEIYRRPIGDVWPFAMHPLTYEFVCYEEARRFVEGLGAGDVR